MSGAKAEAEAREVIKGFESRAARHDVPHGSGTVVWRRFGEGPHLVLLHGGHGSWLHWIRNVDALSMAHAVWIPDMPSFGDSATLAGHPHAADRMTRFVGALHDTLDVLVGAGTSIDLCGFSFGGLAGSQLAAARGDIRRLAFVGVGGHGGERRQSFELLDWRRTPDRPAMLAALRRNLVPFMLHTESRADPLALAIHEWSCVQTRFRSKPISRAGGLAKALEQVQAPMLFIWGEHDVTAVPDDVGARLVHGHGDRKFVVIEGAGHWAQYEKPDEVNARLVEWFRPG